MFKNKKIIIFDMDGTLIDSIGIWNKVDMELISRLSPVTDISEEMVQMQRDSLLRQYSSAEFPYIEYCRALGERYASSLNSDEIHTLRYDIAQDFLRNEIDYKKDAELFLRELKDQGYLLVIASTTRKTGSRSTGLRIIRSGIMQKPLCCCITGNRPYRLSKKGNSI